MGCKGSKHALHGGALEPRRCSGLVARHSVALRSSTLGTLSLDRATATASASAAAVSFPGEEAEAATAKTKTEKEDGAGVGWGRSTLSFAGGWFPVSPKAEQDQPVKRQRLAAPRTPTKTPLRDPEEINVWELMDGLHDDDDEEEYDDCVDLDTRSACGSPEFDPDVLSACGSPEFDPDVLEAFREALVELSPPRDAAVDVNKEEIDVFDFARDGGVGAFKKEEIEVFAGVVRARLDVLQRRIDSKSEKTKPPPSPLPPPDSARRVVVYLTSLRGIRQTYEDCWAASTILASYGVHVDERDLSMHAGYKDELRGALGGAGGLPQVFVDGWHLGGAEEVRRMHESGELAEALEACDAAPCGGAGGKEGPGCFAAEPCGGCGGARFVPCDVCSGSCKVFVGDEDGAGAFKRCPDCNENGLLRCPIC